jgi:hypothetical protein
MTASVKDRGGFFAQEEEQRNSVSRNKRREAQRGQLKKYLEIGGTYL